MIVGCYKGVNMTRYEFLTHKRDLALTRAVDFPSCAEIYLKIAQWATAILDTITVEEAEKEVNR